MNIPLPPDPSTIEAWVTFITTLLIFIMGSIFVIAQVAIKNYKRIMDITEQLDKHSRVINGNSESLVKLTHTVEDATNAPKPDTSSISGGT